MQRILSLAILVLAMSDPPTEAGRPQDCRASFGSADISGIYTSNWGAVTLRQNGTKVIGTYVYQDGQIDGRLDGNLLRYSWREHDSTGHGIFVIATNGDLIGTWGIGNDDLGGGGWRLQPTQRTALAN